MNWLAIESILKYIGIIDVRNSHYPWGLRRMPKEEGPHSHWELRWGRFWRRHCHGSLSGREVVSYHTHGTCWKSTVRICKNVLCRVLWKAFPREMPHAITKAPKEWLPGHIDVTVGAGCHILQRRCFGERPLLRELGHGATSGGPRVLGNLLAQLAPHTGKASHAEGAQAGAHCVCFQSLLNKHTGSRKAALFPPDISPGLPVAQAPNCACWQKTNM